MSDRAIPMMPTHRRAGEHDGRAAQQRLFGGGVPGVLRHLAASQLEMLGGWDDLTISDLLGVGVKKEHMGKSMGKSKSK